MTPPARSFALILLCLVPPAALAQPVEPADSVARSVEAAFEQLRQLEARISMAETEAERASLTASFRQLVLQASAGLKKLHPDDRRTDPWRRELAEIGLAGNASALAVSGGSGFLSGRVTEATTGDPIAGAPVLILGSVSHLVETDGNGDWSTSVSPGNWQVATQLAAPAWIDEAWSDHPCGDFYCIYDGDTIAVSSGQTQSGVDLALFHPGFISGHVYDSLGSPLEGVWITATDQGASSHGAYTDSSGSFTLVAVPGSRRVVAYASQYRAEIWPNTPCTPNCPPGGGSDVDVVEGLSTTGIDFHLEAFGSIVGTVVRASDGTPIAMAFVGASDSSGNSASSQTDAAGTFELASLPDSSYQLYVFAPGLQTIVYPNIPCTPPCKAFSCSVQGGTPILVQAENQTEVAVEVPALAQLRGFVLDETGGQPVAGAAVKVYGTTGTYSCVMGGTQSDAAGEWLVEAPVGTYTLLAQGDASHVDEVFDNMDCWEQSCQVADGSPVQPTLAAVVENLDFSLQTAATLGGTVTEAATGLVPQDIGSLGIRVFDPAFGSKVTPVAADGSWEIARLPAGSWHARVSFFGFGPYHDYRFMVWPDAQCPFGGAPCPDSLGKAIPLLAGEQRDGIDFQVERLGRINGSFQLDDPSLAIVPAERAIMTAGVFDQAGNQLFSTGTLLLSQSYYFRRLEPGAYYLRATSAVVASERWLDVPCPTPPLACNPLEGTPIVIGLDPPPLAVPMSLAARPGFRGIVQDAVSGQPLAGVSVFARPVTPGFDAAAFSDNLGRFYLPLDAGTWRVWVPGPFGSYEPQAWPHLACPPNLGDCGDTGAPLTVEPIPAEPSLFFELYPVGTLFLDGFEGGSLARWSSAMP